LNDVADISRLRVEVGPRVSGPVLVRIVFEREEREIVESAVGFEVIDKAAKPGDFPRCVWPDLDVA